jgi:peptidoglycan/LPS O-acetylase OafA/YrhL
MEDNNSVKPIKVRDTAIDFVKFLAVFLVLNSHMGECYPKYQFFATGGAIGDSLFFFISGFTLFLGRGGGRFDEWYKRRIKRIYPSLVAVAIIGALLFGRNDSFLDVIIAKRYWFVQCIFVLYPFLFLVKKYVSRQLLLLGILTILAMVIYPFVHEGDNLFWGEGYYRWPVYLLFMLLGAIMGMERERIRKMNFWLAVLLTLFCVALWYGIVYFWGKSAFHIISIFPMMGVAVFTYCVGRSKLIENLLHSRRIGAFLISIGALCLESYLIQTMIITDKWNNIFPFNIPVIMIFVLIAAYFAKLLANLIIQTFDSQPLNWEGVLRIY